MKNTLSAFIALLFLSTTLQAQLNCSKYYPLVEGTSFQYTMYDKKGKLDGTSDYKVTNVSSSGNETVAEMKINLTDHELPNDLSVGQQLNEANVTMTVKMAGMNMKTIVNMINRKVEKKENLTTPAGTFECYVIYSENESQIMGMKKTFPSRLWLAEGVGMVKQESYKTNGDLMSTTELTKFDK